MLARDNYSYKKYQKELTKKKKREEKGQRKLDKKNIQAASAEAPRPIGMPSTPLSAADSE
jgi:hypothetical protein